MNDFEHILFLRKAAAKNLPCSKMLCCKQESWNTSQGQIIFTDLFSLLLWIYVEVFLCILANSERIIFQDSTWAEKFIVEQDFSPSTS